MALTSKFAQLFVNLQTYIAAQVVEFKWIDQNFGQLEVGERPAVLDGFCLIDFIDTNFEDHQFSQYGNMNIEITLGFNRYQNTSNITAELTKEQALKYYEIEHKLHGKLQGYLADGILQLPMKRINASTEKRFEPLGMRVRKINYYAQMEDESVGGA